VVKSVGEPYYSGNMKNIQSVPIWNNGSLQEALILDAYVLNDNLINQASFYYALLDGDQRLLAQGNLIITGSEYTAYETNLYAWDWIAGKLNLTITGDYIPPAPAPFPIVP